jgi:hypothetical protein
MAVLYIGSRYCILGATTEYRLLVGRYFPSFTEYSPVYNMRILIILHIKDTF